MLMFCNLLQFARMFYIYHKHKITAEMRDYFFVKHEQYGYDILGKYDLCQCLSDCAPTPPVTQNSQLITS